MRICAIWAGLLAVPLVASGHHSLFEFDRAVQQEIEGEVLKVMWTNPHVRLTVRTQALGGAQATWELTGLDLNSLDRRGVAHDLVKVGDTVRVSGNPSNRRERQLYVSNLLVPNGTEIMVSPTAEPLWSETIVGRPESVGETLLASAQGTSIFRVWSAAAGVRDTRHFPFTAAAIASRSAWDEDDNFASRCEPEGMPRIMTNPHPFQFVDHGATLAMRSELYDLTRTIHMDGADAAADQAASPLGYSVGHWQQSTLVVATTRANWPYFDNIGTRQSDSAQYVERFTLGEDPARLDYQLTITDPATFTEPAIYERYWLALGEDLQTYDCQTY